MTLRDVLQNYLAQSETAKRKSLPQMRVRASAILADLSGDTLPTDIDAKVLGEYRFRREQRVSPVTVNRELEVLRAAFNLCDLPWPKVARAPENNVRSGFFTDEEFTRLCGFMHSSLRRFARWGYYTGWRKGEIAGLRWDRNVFTDDLGTMEVRLFDTKNGRPRIVPVSGPLVSILKEAVEAKRDGCQWVFHDGTGNQMKDFRKSWASACKYAGLEGRLFHDLRRTAVRNMILAGVDKQTAKKITGHVTDSMFERYQIVDTAQIKSALERL